MLYLTCTTITSVDLAHYRVSRAKDWASVDCGTINPIALRTAKTLWSFDHSECNRVKACDTSHS